MAEVDMLNRPGTRILLAGTGTHPVGSSLPDVPAVARTLHGLEQVLPGRTILDATPRKLHDALISAAEEATDLLVFYYVGHGLVSASGELHLATAETDDYARALATKTLPYTAVRDALLTTSARHVVVVLDCCFAGRAGMPVTEAQNLAGISGTFLLTSSAREEQALAPEGAEFTAFSGALITFLREGTPREGARLTLEGAYRYLVDVARRRHFPVPVRQLSGETGNVALAGNPAARPEAEPGVAPADGPCPYLGMDSFTVTDSRYFFGRESVVEDLVRSVGRPGVVAVVGPSGVGKSSVLQAGLVPALGWPHAVLSPGDPLPARSERLLLVVDQFEEVFALPAEERQAFVSAVSAAGEWASVVLGVRADFAGRCLELLPALGSRQVVVRRMDDTQLRQAIEKPAAAANLTLAPGLVDRLLRDLRGDDDPSGALPLLSYALMATWQRREGTKLTLAGYEATGGIWQAVTRRADETYAALSRVDQAAAKTLLLSMVRVIDGVEDARRKVPVDLDSPVVKAFADARLITVDEKTARITHEALLRAWPTLRGWIDEDRAGLLVRQQLAEAAQEWTGNRDRGRLYRGARLAVARQWRRENDVELSPVENEFLGRSVAAHRRGRWLAVGAVAVLVLGTLIGLYSAQQANIQRSQRLASLAMANLGTDPNAALHFSLAAYREYHTDEATRALYATYNTPRPIILHGHDPKSTIISVAFRADGNVLASSANDRTIRLWDATDPANPVAAAVLPSAGTTSGIAFSPHGNTLVAHAENVLTVWDVTDPRHPVRTAEVASPSAIPGLAAFSADGHTVAVGGLDKQPATIWDVSARPVLLATLPLPTGDDVTGVAFSPDGKVLAARSYSYATGSSSVTLWTPGARPELLSTIPDARSAWNVTFSPDGKNVVTGSPAGGFNVWDVTDPRAPGENKGDQSISKESNGQVMATAFAPDGERLIATSRSGVAQLIKRGYDGAITGGVPVSLPSDTDEYSAVFHPNGQIIVIGGDKGTIQVWGRYGTSPMRVSLPNSDFPGSAFSPDGKMLVTFVKDKNVQIWRPTDTRTPITTLSPASIHAGFLADGQLLTLDKDPPAVRFWNVDERGTVALRMVVPVTGPNPGDMRISVSENGRVLAMVRTGRTREIRMWDVTGSGPVPITFPGPAPDTGSFVRNLFVSWQLDDKDVYIHWRDMTDPGAVGPDVLLENSVGADAISFTNKVVVHSRNGGLSFWDMARLDEPLLNKINGISEFAVFHDGGTLAAASSVRHEVTLWNVKDPRNPAPISKMALTDTSVHQLIFSDDEHYLVSRGGDELHIWDISTPSLPKEKINLPVNAYEAEFGPDNKTIAVEYDDEEVSGPGVRIWDLDPAEMYHLMCTSFKNPLDETGWTARAPDLSYVAACPTGVS